MVQAREPITAQGDGAGAEYDFLTGTLFDEQFTFAVDH
jgi:hypothetical protein